jgi:hypothetical protein
VNKINRSLHESLLKIWDFFHECEKFLLFTSASTCFFRFNLKTKHVDFIHSFIRMSMSCLLHKILQRHVQCSKLFNTHFFFSLPRIGLDREHHHTYTLVATSADSVSSSYLVRITIAPIGTTFGNLQ